MRSNFPDLDLILIESGGDNLAATFSPELADLSLYVIDTAVGQDIPRKRGPGVTLMQSDTAIARSPRPYVMARLRQVDGIDTITAFLQREGGLRLSPAPH